MKIRTDFVTNSSSSSFIVAVKEGTSTDEIKKIVEKQFQGAIKEMISDLGSDEELEEQYDGSMSEYFYEKLNGTPLEGGSAYCDSGKFSVGISPSALLKRFGDRKICEIPQIVAEEIEKALGVKIDPKKVTYIEEASYNG